MTAAAADEVALAILRFDDGEEILVAFDPDQPRGPDGRWIELGFGQLTLPGIPALPTKPQERLTEKLATMKIKHGSWKPLGGGTSTTYRAELEDGTPVMVKARLTEDWLREEVDATRGLEHAKASQDVADYFGVPTPRIANRTLRSLGGIPSGADDAEMPFDPDEEVQVQEWMDDFDGPDLQEPDEDEAERLTVLDAVIGNTDRHDGNFGYRDGKLTAIDMDLTFPGKNAESWGNYVKWVSDQTGEEIFGQPLSKAMKKKILDMVKNRDDWEEKLRKDGLTVEERTAMWERILNIEDFLQVPHPPSGIGEPMYGDWHGWEHYYGEGIVIGE